MLVESTEISKVPQFDVEENIRSSGDDGNEMPKLACLDKMQPYQFCYCIA